MKIFFKCLSLKSKTDFRKDNLKKKKEERMYFLKSVPLQTKTVS